MKRSSVFMALCCVFGMSAHSAYAKCEKPSTILELLKMGKDGETAFAEMNLEQLLLFSTSAREIILPCLKEKITTPDASAFHRLMALEAFTHNDKDRVVAEFHAARKLDPGYKLPLDVASDGHPLRILYEKSAFAEDGELKLVFPPKGGYVTVGGVRDAPRPEKTPAIIQAFDPFNKVIETRYLQPGETLPSWGKNPFGITAKDLGIDQKSAWITPKTWYISAGVTAVITGALYGVAMYNKSQFQDTSGHDTVDSDHKLQGYSDRANAFGVASVVTGSLSLVFGGIGAGFHVFSAEEKPSHAVLQTRSGP